MFPPPITEGGQLPPLSQCYLLLGIERSMSLCAELQSHPKLANLHVPPCHPCIGACPLNYVRKALHLLDYSNRSQYLCHPSRIRYQEPQREHGRATAVRYDALIFGATQQWSSEPAFPNPKHTLQTLKLPVLVSEDTVGKLHRELEVEQLNNGFHPGANARMPTCSQ